jgi:hypothetical protein
MGKVQAIKQERRLWKALSVEDRADIAEQTQTASLYYCDHPWAISHRFANKETGEVIRARCNRWDCLHCGPRKVDLWRQVVKQAEPVLFLTLTKAGKTVAQAARALTTFMQALRRGSKGRGRGRVGAREAYPVEYFAVLERHNDFERNGFHWHLLIKGVDHLPYKEVIVPLWTSAIKGKRTEEEMLKQDYGFSDEEVWAFLHEEDEEGNKKGFRRYGWIERVRNARAIGYVTKYLTKSLTLSEVGTRQMERERVVAIEDDQGEILGFEKRVELVEVASKAHRIRYSRHFFPERVAALRKRLFEGMEPTSMEGGNDQKTEDGKPLEVEEEEQGSSWELVERGESERVNVEEYKRRRYAELVEGLSELREEDPEEYQKQKRLVMVRLRGEVRELVQDVYSLQKRRVLIEALEEDRHISRRVISMWDYQRKQLELAG